MQLKLGESVGGDREDPAFLPLPNFIVPKLPTGLK